MIIGFFLSVLFIFVNFIVSVLPTVEFPTQIPEMWNTIFGLMNSVNFLFPVYQLMLAVVIGLGFHIAMILWYHGHMGGRYVRGR